ncbi:MAG: glycosyltransferase, partial [Candidatus Krumholzibacteriota bacterium]|nr:glycosyltransferase [Candidatus Krumholzibacteriota bacterium]
NELGMGGVEKKLYDFVSRIDTTHFNVTVCCLKEGGYFRDAFMRLGVRVYEGLLAHKYDVLAYPRLLRVIRAEQIDLVYTFAHPNTMLFSALARATGRVRGLVVSFHAMGNPEGGKLLRPWQRTLLRTADRVLAVAKMHKQYLVDVERLRGDCITVIHNGVDVEKYRPGPRSESLAAELGVKDGEVVITTVASLNPRKRIDLLLAAAARIIREFPNARFLIAGDGQERERLESLAAQLNISRSVTFAGVRDDISDILRLSNLFVLPSRRGTETFPNVVLEAMASGLPVVSTDVGSVRELIANGENGTLVAPENEDALVSSIRALLAAPTDMAAYGARSREIVENKFRLERMCSQRERLFSEILC